MFIKRGMVGSSEQKLFLLALGLILTIVLSISISSSIVSAETGRECNLPSENARDNYCGGASIYTPGYGAVELCQVCHQCGLSDGVCPEDYSDGQNETNVQELSLMLRVKRPVFYGDTYSVSFQNGDIACATIHGTCDYVQKSSDLNTWTNVGAGGCSLNVSTVVFSNNEYYKAVCKGVPRAPRCELCPDPDCSTTVSGMAYRELDGVPISDVTVEIKSSNNSLLSVFPNGTTNYNGVYSMQGVTGYLNVTCYKAGYVTVSTLNYLKQGKNIVDCVMAEIGLLCTPQCYYTDASGNSICSAACDGKNGCGMSELAKTSCNGLSNQTSVFMNSTVFVNATDNCSYENVTSLTCCKGMVSSEVSAIYAPGGCGGGATPITEDEYLLYNEGNLSNMLVRNYKKEMNGRTLTLSIRTYTK